MRILVLDLETFELVRSFETDPWCHDFIFGKRF